MSNKYEYPSSNQVVIIIIFGILVMQCTVEKNIIAHAQT